MTVVICDTHVLLFDALEPARLSRAARLALDRAENGAELACADITLWEMAMVFERKRDYLRSKPAQVLIQEIIDAREVRVLAIDAETAAAAAGLLSGRTDPFDRLIAATAITRNAPLISADERLHGIPGLKIIW